MNAIEAVEQMKLGKKITYGGKKDFWFELFHDGSIESLLQDTSCSARILGYWKTTDDFIEAWNKTGGSRGPVELENIFIRDV